jgi:hypothetical protein
MALTATDRCDHCMAQAYVTVDSIAWASSLLFCSFHYASFAVPLAQLDQLVVIDERTEDMKWREVGER